MITGKLMTAPVWLKAAAADPSEAAAQLYSRLLVAREIGPVYGHGVLPDWVKAAQTPAPGAAPDPTPTPAVEPEPPKPSFMQRAENVVREPAEGFVQRNDLSKRLPASNSNPGDPLGALGSSIRPALIGTGIGAGVGLLGGLTGKKKRPIRGLLMGGLAGGLAGGAGGYLYDRFAGAPPADKPTPEKIQEASDQIQSQAPGIGNELHAGVLSPETWSGPELNKLLPQMGKDVLVGGGVGAAVGAGVGATYRGAANVANKGSRTEYEIPTKFSPKGKPTIDTAATGKQLLKPSKVTAVESAMAGARRGGRIGATAAPALTLYQHAKDHGVTELDSANPALAAEGIQKLTAYSPSIPPPPSNPADPASVAKAQQIMAERQKLLLEAKQRQAELTALAQTGQGLSAAERQKNDDLRTRLGVAGLIQIQPVGKRR